MIPLRGTVWIERRPDRTGRRAELPYAVVGATEDDLIVIPEGLTERYGAVCRASALGAPGRFEADPELVPAVPGWYAECLWQGREDSWRATVPIVAWERPRDQFEGPEPLVASCNDPDLGLVIERLGEYLGDSGVVAGIRYRPAEDWASEELPETSLSRAAERKRERAKKLAETRRAGLA